MRTPSLNVSDWLLLLIGALAITLLLVQPRIAFNYSNSIPRGFYRFIDEIPAKGDYTLLDKDSILKFAGERGYIAKDTSIGKKIVAIGGDTVVVSSSGVVINGKIQSNSRPKTYDSQGRVMPALRDTLILNGQEVFLLGDNKNSFDGRYFGSVTDKAISGKLKPLFTF